MMNSTSAPTLEGDEFSEENPNLNKVASLPIMMSHERSQYHSSLLFEGDNDDEVFEDYQETSSMIMSREPRVRRISDVIDSIGCSPSSPISRSSSNFDFSEKTVTEESICIVRREEVKYINLETPPKGRRGLQSVTDSLLSETPPTTPTSDLGYCSAGLQTPPTTLVFKPKWCRFSASSDQSSPPKQDTMMDAQVMCAPTESQEKPMETSEPNAKSGAVTPIVYPKAKMPVSMKSLEYNMDHPRMGYAVIFNHEEFLVDNTPPRVGSKLDANRLSETLKALGFWVTIHHDLDSDKIKMRINELAAMDHGECNCVLVAVLSHGMGTSYILSHDYPYPVDMLWSPFTPDRCDTLAGKPKIFLIQACRGDKLDGGVHLISNRTQTDSNSTNNYKIPAMADFLIAYSTAEGFYSWRNPLKGTWFIQSLCDVLDAEAYNHDFQTLLLMVAQKVAVDHESYSDLYPWQHQQKQVPQTVSTLIRKIFFKQNP